MNHRQRSPSRRPAVALANDRQPIRVALARGLPMAVAGELPYNYQIAHADVRDDGDWDIIIVGRDADHWTLHGHVLPRLNSFMVYAVELIPRGLS